MKTTKRFFLAALVAMMSLSAVAQQVNTLFFLENAPMRHTLNPAFQPVSRGFINFTPLGWMSIGMGNNSLMMSSIFRYDPATGKTIIIPLHPNGDKQAFLGILKSMTLMDTEMTLGLLNMGFRIKENGYLTIGFNERIESGGTLPKSLFNFALNGGMTNLTPGESASYDLSGLSSGGSAYTEIGVGYSHKINDQWTVGGKLKFLLGQMDMRVSGNGLGMTSINPDTLVLRGNLDVQMAGPINYDKLPEIEDRTVKDITNDLHFDDLISNNIGKLLTPSGYGAAIDLGFTYKPIEQLQISAAINDLGFIYWTNARKYTGAVDTTFTGVGVIDYGDDCWKDEDGNFSGQKVLDSVFNSLPGLANSITMHSAGSGYAKMISARMNIGLDANFWENRVGVGILSATRLYNARLYEEVTIGAAFRPFNWLNLAVSYSLMNNGQYSNIGAGLSIMPYDGVNMTLAMDYIPTSYAAIPNTNKYFLPSKAKMLNVALGFSICWGSNRKDKDKDGVWDKLDMCPNTPRGIEVDIHGCPFDEDNDGVPDYLDHCLGTPEGAIGHVDSLGCELDTDGDGVPDWRDRCPNTPAAAIGYVDSLGCELDTDGDGISDYMDECGETPEAAYGRVDEKGCPLDTDGDGIADYMDECANTPAEAGVAVDAKGCPLDTDGDGVADYLDHCPNTPAAAIGHVDTNGCELDSDGDGVPDYMDECPLVEGTRANKGCPEVKREVRKLLQKAMQGIEFETGKAAIKKKSFALLDEIATIFIENSNYMIEIQGHTDNTGKAEVNKRISQQRAEAVKKYLEKKGVDGSRMTAVGYGQDEPIADNKTAAGRQKNRRVEFKISFEEVHYETVLDHADPKPEQQPEQTQAE